MLRKTLLKNTREFLEKNLPENLFLKRKLNKKQKNLVGFKRIILQKKLLKFKKEKLYHLKSLKSRFFMTQKASYAGNNKENIYTKPSDFLFSMPMVKAEFEKKQTRNSTFKNKLKEKKKLSILYGNLSNKEIKKTLQKAFKLHGNTSDNVLLILESRLDVILYRAFFFSSISCARQWIRYNKILVNSKCVNIPSYKANFADIISVNKKEKKIVGNAVLKFFLHHNLYTEKIFNEQCKLQKQFYSSFEKKKNSKKKRNEKCSLIISNLTVYNYNLIKFLTKKINKYKNKVNYGLSVFGKKDSVVFSKFWCKAPFGYDLSQATCKGISLSKPGFYEGFKPRNLFYYQKNFLSLQKKPYIYNQTILNFIKKKFYNQEIFFYDINKVIKNCSIETLNVHTFFKSIFMNFGFKYFLNMNTKNFGANSFTKNFPDLGFRKIQTQKKIQNIFNKKNYFTISNFFFEKIKNQITPVEQYLLKKSIETLFKIFVFLNQVTRTNTNYLNLNNENTWKKILLQENKLLKKLKKEKNHKRKKRKDCTSLAKSEKLKIKIIAFSTLALYKKNALLKYNFSFNDIKSTKLLSEIKKMYTSQILLCENYLDIHSKILLNIINKNVIEQTKEMISFLLNANYLSTKKKNFYFKNLPKLNSIKYYDILFFLRLKTFFFQKHEIFENKTSSCLKTFFFKPLYLEISYKTLTVIYLYSSQKILFPCTLDVELLTKK